MVVVVGLYFFKL